MKWNILIITTTIALIFSGCLRVNTEHEQQIELGAVTDAVETRASSTSPLKQGSRFRLYILPDGETNIANLIATRTYTISDNAGTPVLDAGQRPIKIAQDEYDFYIVGPLMGVNEQGTEIEIASEVGVNVYAGNDIVSSLTNVTVVSGSNRINPQPLHHRMAKIDLVIERPAGATYENLRVDEILLFDQPVTGSFTFGADGGSITPETTTHTRRYAPPVQESEDRFVAVDYIFGHTTKKVKIETTFDAEVYINGIKQTNTYYGQSGSVETEIEVGKAYEIKANPFVPTELLWRLTLVDWYEREQGSTSSDNRELIASFSGLDAPMELNGKKYWRDRSGNDNHGELVGSVVYNSDDKYYTTTTTSGSYIELSALGEMKDITVELVMSSAYDGYTTPFYALGSDGTTQARVHVPYSEADLYLDWGESNPSTDRVGPVSHRFNDFGFYQGMSTWQYTRKVNAPDISAAIYHNGDLVYGENKRLRTLDFDKVRFLSDGGSVTKLYGVRIYRRVLTPTEMTNSANNDKALYAKISTDDIGKYVQKGLILDLQGADVPSTSLVANKTVWQDRSIYGNHAVLLNGGPTHDALKKGYQFSGTNKIMQLLRGLGDLTNCTIEIVMTGGTSSNCNNLNFMDRTGTNVYTFGSPNVKYTSVFPGVEFKVNDTPSYSTELTHTWSTVRDVPGRTITLYQNGYYQVTSNASQQRTVTIPVQSLILDPITLVQIGGKLNGDVTFDGLIHAIRVYNRPLNDTERYVNYELDQKKYNIPSNAKYLPPVKNGLIFCFDGRHAPKTIGTTKYWVDEVAKNDAKLIGQVSYNAAESYYSVPANRDLHYMLMLNNVAMHNNFTAELVLKQDGLQNGSPVYWGIPENPVNGVICRYLYMHTPFPGDMKIYVDSPGFDRYSFPWPSNIGSYTALRKIVVRRAFGSMNQILIDNKIVGSGNATTDMSSLVCSIMKFGGQEWGGRFYTVRYYDRALTDAELKANYDHDVKTFNIPTK